ncbi:ABC transporter permease subunit [Bacillus nitroreducens]
MKNWSLWTGLLLLGLMLFISYIGPHLPFIEHTPPEHRMRFYENGEFGRAPFPPSKEDLLGTDREARDILSLIILGAKDTLKIIVLITVIRYIIAIPLAFLASTKKGIAYMVTNGWHSLFGSIPTIFAAILLVEIVPVDELGNGMYWKVLLISLIEIGRVSYIFAHEIYDVSQKEFVKASVTVGSTPFQLSVMHYLPTISQSLVVNFFNDLARVTLLIGQLALFEYFIEHAIEYIPGGGIFHEEAGYNSKTGIFDWPGLLSAARYEVMRAAWIALSPAVALTLLLLTFQLLSEGFRKMFERPVSSGKNRVVRSLIEQVSETFVSSRIAGPVTLAVFLVIVGIVVVSGVEKRVTEVTVPVEEVEIPGFIEDGRYERKDGQLVPTTEATTRKGGHYDKLSYLEQHMTKRSEQEYETDTLLFYCQFIGDGRCDQPKITFKEPVSTTEEAFGLLQEHLPDDVMVDEIRQTTERSIYLLSSKRMEESYAMTATLNISQIKVTFEITPEDKIEEATVQTGHW